MASGEVRKGAAAGSERGGQVVWPGRKERLGGLNSALH